jgi:hypothetical protein
VENRFPADARVGDINTGNRMMSGDRPGRDVSTEKTPRLHHSVRPLSYCLTTDMKRAFVLRLTPEARPVDGTFQGRVEEVDSGRNVKFGTIDEFLNFLQQCLDHQQTPEE